MKKYLFSLLFSFVLFGQAQPPAPDYQWEIYDWPEREFRQGDENSYANQVQGTNKYLPGSVEFVAMDGQTVLKRNYTKGNVGCCGTTRPPDFWRIQPAIDRSPQAYTMQMYIKFPVGFFSKVRAGKLPIGFKSERFVDVGKYYSKDNQPDAFSSIVMFWCDKDENGKAISVKNMDPNRNTAAIGDFLYAYRVPRKNGKWANIEHIYRGNNGKGYRLKEGEWHSFLMTVKLNDPGKANGYIRMWAARPSDGSSWQQISNRTGLEIRNKEAFQGGDQTIFQGGGSPSLAPNGWGPTQNVSAYYAGWMIWKGEKEPSWQAFTPEGAPWVYGISPGNIDPDPEPVDTVEIPEDPPSLSVTIPAAEYQQLIEDSQNLIVSEATVKELATQAKQQEEALRLATQKILSVEEERDNYKGLFGKQKIIYHQIKALLTEMEEYNE